MFANRLRKLEKLTEGRPTLAHDEWSQEAEDEWLKRLSTFVRLTPTAEQEQQLRERFRAWKIRGEVPWS